MFGRICSVCYETLYVFSSWIAVLFQVIFGLWKLSRVPKPRVTFFGGAHLKLDDPDSRAANKLAQLCVKNEISVVTGGGPGIMEAANCGALESNHFNTQRTIGITIKNLTEEDVNVCAIGYNIVLRYFFARKWLLINYSEAFVVFPGGFGTMDELSEVLTLMKSRQLRILPIILYNSRYWKPFLEWVDLAVKQEIISEDILKLITVSDSLEEIFSILEKQCKSTKI